MPEPGGVPGHYVPVYHRMNGQSEHIAFYVNDPGSSGYLSETKPLKIDGTPPWPPGQTFGQASCPECDDLIVAWHRTWVRREAGRIFLRTINDPLAMSDHIP